MRGLLIAFLVAAPLAGCVVPAEGTADWVVEAPVWEPGYTWDWVATNAEGSYPGHLQVLAPETRLGLEGFVLWGNNSELHKPFGTVHFTTPDRMGLLSLSGSGTIDDMCSDWSAYSTRAELPGATADGDGAPPKELQLIPFPLRPGLESRRDDFLLGNSSTRWIQATTVTGRGPVETPAGTFDAVRMEVRRWWESDDPKQQAAWAKLGKDEATARSGPALAILHYAPDVHHVVRLEGLVHEHMRVPGATSTFVSLDDEASPYQGVIELHSFRLQPAAALSGPQLSAKAMESSGFCANEPPAQADPPLPKPSVGFAPRATTFEAPGQDVAWSVTYPSPGATYAWSVADAAGTVLGGAQGTTFSWRFDRTGAYVVTLTGERDGDVASNGGYVVVGQSMAGTLACDTVVADGFATTFGVTPPPGSCAPIQLDIGPGHAFLQATIQHGAEGRVPCSHLDLVDASGTVVDSVFTRGTEVRLSTMPPAGPHALVWHPGAHVAAAPTYEVKLTYVPPGQGFGWAGAGSPGC